MNLKTFLLAGVAICWALPAMAQDEVTQTENQTEEGEVQETVVVTGRYTHSQPIDTATGLGLTQRETPQAVTIVTAQRILDENLDTLTDIVGKTVGLSVSASDDVRNTFKARGFDVENYQIDGVSISWELGGAGGETIADVSIYERVEFVRGATGLLTGMGSPSASINLVRKHADQRSLAGYVQASAGSWNNRQIEADVGSALNEDGTIRGRFVAKYQDGESYMDMYEFEKLVLYGTVEADLGENTIVRAGASRQTHNPNAASWGSLPAWYDDGAPIKWSRSKTSAQPWTYWDTEGIQYFANIEHKFENGWNLRLDYNRYENIQDARVFLAYASVGQMNKVTGLGVPYYVYSDRNEVEQDSYDIRLSGEYGVFGRNHDFMVGATYSVRDLDGVTYASIGPNFGVTTPDFNNWNETSFPDPGFSSVASPAQKLEVVQKGFFAATRLNILDQFKIIAGGRLASWEREGFTGLSNATPTRVDFGDNDVFIPYAGALYDITPEHRLYVSYTEIFKPQNARDRGGAFLKPIVGKAYEGGIKSAFMNEALQVSAAIFRIEQDNLAQPDPGFLVPGTITQAQRAADGTTSEGFEIEIVGKITDNWKISGGYSQFKAEDASGRDVNTNEPRRSFAAFTTYDFDGQMEGLTVGGGLNWSSQRYLEGGGVRLAQEPFTLVNIMARYNLTDNVAVQANIENLLDQKYYNPTDPQSYRYGAPRNYTIGLTYRF